MIVFKDERLNPQVKRLRLAFADSPHGPWQDVTDPFTADWVEGPSVAQAGNEWFVYFDHYGKPQHYAALRTKALEIGRAAGREFPNGPSSRDGRKDPDGAREETTSRALNRTKCPSFEFAAICFQYHAKGGRTFCPVLPPRRMKL